MELCVLVGVYALAYELIDMFVKTLSEGGKITCGFEQVVNKGVQRSIEKRKRFCEAQGPYEKDTS